MRRALWFLIYIFVLFGFLLHPVLKPKSGGLTVAAHACVFWLFCIGDFFAGRCYLLS